jgi:hypothetical protein
MATSKKGRAFAGFGAALFLITSSATTVLVIMVLIQQNKKEDPGASTQNVANNQTQEKKVALAGTPLANFTPQAHIDKLQAQDTTPGTGDAVKVGGTRRLYIPAALAYGANPPAGSGIPANADLVFDITLYKIGK